MRGFIPGETLLERLAWWRRPWRMVGPILREGSPARRVNGFRAEEVRRVRQMHDGPVGYAAGSWEAIDWSGFDVVGVDSYLGRGGPDRYLGGLRAAAGHGKPLIVTELGSCTYTGAARRGGMGWAVLKADPLGGRRVREGLVRDEEEQARAVVTQLEACERAGADAAFVFTFVMPAYPHVEDDPAHDVDLASYGLVAPFPEGSGRRGPYLGLQWRPKAAFGGLAAWNLDRGADRGDTMFG
jgi:hypothetical protein